MPTPTPRTAERQADKAEAEVQEIVDQATKRGYFGETVDPEPNSAYSLLSGPDAPPLVPDNTTRTNQPAFRAKEG